jgi:hypothetical protein
MMLELLAQSWREHGLLVIKVWILGSHAKIMFELLDQSQKMIPGLLPVIER